MTQPPKVTRRPPAFTPVPLRARADGWTALRQAAFLGMLAQTRSVVAAAQSVGMARETAYRLRARAGAESFAAAWDAVMGRAVGGKWKVTNDALWHQTLHGKLKPVMRGGCFVGIIRKADNSALLRLLARLDRADRPWPGEAEGHRKKSGIECKPVAAKAVKAGAPQHNPCPSPHNPPI